MSADKQIGTAEKKGVKGRRKRVRSSNKQIFDEGHSESPKPKRVASIESGSDSDSVGGLVIADDENVSSHKDVNSPSPDPIEDIPMEALLGNIQYHR
jgi:hypothetical protein